jgi:hypothetical protein
VSYNKLKELLKLGSVGTVKNYIDYLENSWLFFVVNKYAYSVKEQQIAAKKVYSIDTGLTESVSFSFSKNEGRLMENIVFLKLRRKLLDDIYYYKTAKGYEVDFFLPKRNMFIQVTNSIETDDVKNREVRALLEAGREHEDAILIIVTQNEKTTIQKEDKSITVIPLYEWLLNDLE